MKKVLSIVVLAMIAAFISCSKDDSSDNNSANQNKICNGVTSNSIIPLKQGDAWTWTTLGFGSIIETVVGKKTINSVEYFDVTHLETAFSQTNHHYYRVAANGDVYQNFSENQTNEYLLIPANPTVGQNWQIQGAIYMDKRTVKSLTATVKTSKCTYSNCIVIDESNTSNGSVISTLYYKKGIGLVKSTSTYINEELKEVTLN
jgi:hypothetical protein